MRTMSEKKSNTQLIITSIIRLVKFVCEKNVFDENEEDDDEEEEGNSPKP